MLKAKLTNEQYDKADESQQNLYKKTSDGYILQVDGMVSSEDFQLQKDKVNEFRENNVKYSKQLDGITPEELSEFKANKQKALDKSFIDANDIDGLVNSKVNVITSDFEAKLQAANERGDKYKNLSISTTKKYEIEGATSKALGAHKIRPDFNEAVNLMVSDKFTVNNGAVVAMDGDQILTGANGNLTVDEFVGSLSESYKIQSNGGGGQGGGGPTGTDKTSQQKIASGLANLIK